MLRLFFLQVVFYATFQLLPQAQHLTPECYFVNSQLSGQFFPGIDSCRSFAIPLVITKRKPALRHLLETLLQASEAFLLVNFLNDV